MWLPITKDLSVSFTAVIEVFYFPGISISCFLPHPVIVFSMIHESGRPRESSAESRSHTLYGGAASACAALGVNPALGIIHRGDHRSLLFDLADIYKATLLMPIAFQVASEVQPLEYARKTLRQQLYKKRVLGEMLKTLMEVFAPLLPTADGDRLIDDDGEAAGHKQYGG